MKILEAVTLFLFTPFVVPRIILYGLTVSIFIALGVGAVFGRKVGREERNK